MVFVKLNCVISSLAVPQREKMSSVKSFQTSCFKALWFKISVTTLTMKIFAKPTAIFSWCSWYFHVLVGSFLHWKEFSTKISLSVLYSSRVGTGGSFPWNYALYALHAKFILSFCGIFVYKLVMSIETRIVFSRTFVFSKKLMKWVVSFRHDFCCGAIGW